MCDIPCFVTIVITNLVTMVTPLQARDEMELLTERMQSSSDGVLSELMSKERELEDAMMTVSLMQVTYTCPQI